jgi:two-component system, cell cycle sensor histidine kinase and response regulator CckA
MPRNNTRNHLPCQPDKNDEIGLLQSALIEIGSAQDVSSAFTAVLRLVCEKTGWTIAQVWMPNEEGTVLERHAVWPDETNRGAEKFVAASDRMTFPPGKGLPGRVWSSAEPVWILDVSQDSNFPLATEARAAGIMTALGIPVLSDGEVIAVLEFFFRERREEEDQLTVLIATVAAQLGWAIRHKRAYDRLRASEERYRTLVESAPICIHEIDKQMNLTTVNPAGLRLLGGAKASEVCGMSALNLVSAEDQPRIAALLHRAFAGEFCEFEFVTADVRGEPRAFLSCFIPLRDKHGVINKVLGTSQDITNHKKAEEQLRQAQKMDAVGRLAGGVAHDFNNILNVIIGHAYLMQSEPTPEGARVSVTEIRKAAERATSLIRQLLAFSRKQVPQLQSRDLNNIVAGIGDMLRRLIGEDVDLRINPASDLPYVTADAGQIEQIIMNLAVNARDAMPHGGTLTIATCSKHLDDQDAGNLGLTPGLYVVLTVADTGHGMDATTQARIFEPFFTTKEFEKGTGLGLAIVSRIVRQSSGHIAVESNVGEGTTFKVYLPVTDKNAAAIEQATVVRPLTAASETILLVEDDESVRKLTKLLLETEGYTVIEAENGTSALDITSSYRSTIHLLVTDLVMPGMQGRDLAAHFRRQRPGIKVLYVTGYADEVAMGGGTVLEKPFTPDELIRRVRAVLAGPDEISLSQAG